MTFKVPVAKVDSITTHPTQPHNSVVQAGGYSIVTMKNEDGSFRFAEGELVILVPENAIVPDGLLQQHGFWNDAKNKVGLAGSRGNRVKGRVVDGVPSEALIWTAVNMDIYEGADLHDTSGEPTRVIQIYTPTPEFVYEGSDVADMLGITEYIPQ